MPTRTHRILTLYRLQSGDTTTGLYTLYKHEPYHQPGRHYAREIRAMAKEVFNTPSKRQALHDSAGAFGFAGPDHDEIKELGTFTHDGEVWHVFLRDWSLYADYETLRKYAGNRLAAYSLEPVNRSPFYASLQRFL